MLLRRCCPNYLSASLAFMQCLMLSMVFLLSRLFYESQSQLFAINFIQCWRAFEWVV